MGKLTRLYVLCAVLAGLFLMHGSPASAASGCHRTAAAAPTEEPTADHAAAPAHHAMADPDPGPGPTAAPAEPGHGHPGEVCLATPAQHGQPLAQPGTAPYAVEAAARAVDGPARSAADGPRAPPSGGRDVTVRNCVSRT
ncbi:hypothetical protein ABT095_15695 [Kitasatospora sp. NPDC002227]|uniref:hypothetical protein n=1 Tax=Kitasatospora sp. NPDC002227 TaxID=3154773 RepID=UPI003330B83C